MLPGMKSRNIDVRTLIKKLEDVLSFLDENDFAIPAIKVEEAINALQQLRSGEAEIRKHG